MLRRRSIRLRIIVLVLVPVIALIGLYAVALSLTLSSYLTLSRSANVRNEITNPVANVQLQLSLERGLALQYLANPSHARLLGLLSQEPKTDAVVNDFLNVAGKAQSDAAPGEQHAIEKWAAELGSLHALRATVVSVSLSLPAAAASYSALVADAGLVLTQAVLPVLNNAALVQANGILTMEDSLQAISEARDVLAADLTIHTYLASDARLVSQLIVEHRDLWNQGTASLDRQYLSFFASDIPASTAARLANLENRVLVSQRSAMGVSPQAWTSVNNAYAAGFRKALRGASDAIRATGSAQGRGVLLRLILIGGLGLIAIAGTIAIALVLSRALLRQLDDLRLSALDLSSVRLPALLARLRSGQEIDVATETPQLDPGAAEIGQLGRAFNIAAQAAVAAAVDEAQIRRGVNDVFRNLARRNQSLLTRQLELLDAMERRVHDPEELADLFRVDHLTTRMRRHAEGLLIVAGGSSGRVWREPVPVVDVMRAAVAEIEDYTRIRVTSRSSSSIAGHAVADIIHMLAELVENATTFSPANTPVRIESDNVAKGLVVEIEDRGLGMTQQQVDQINAKLVNPPLFDLSGSEQLGLFIAGQLARRHDVRITMRGSAYGGITAVVLIPGALVIDPGYDEPLAVVGVRELGGRPVPQLPAASPAGTDLAAATSSPASPDHVSAAGYILGLETGAGSVTTTAAQIDTGQIDPRQPATGPRAPIAGYHLAPEVVAADLVDGATLPGAGTSETAAGADRAADSDAEPAGLKGAGAWLREAESAVAGQDPGGITPEATISPAMDFGQLGRPSGDVSDPAEAPYSALDPDRVDHSVGWPVRAPEDQASDQPPAPDILAGGSVGWPDRPAPPADWLKLSGAIPEPGFDSPASADHAQPLPQRQAQDRGAPFGRDLLDTDSFGPMASEASPLEIDGLPVRVRQANLAPQLRDPEPEPTADQGPTVLAQKYVAAPEMPAEQPGTVEPSPEAARSFMSALQRGWERGRSMAEHMTDQPDDEQS